MMLRLTFLLMLILLQVPLVAQFNGSAADEVYVRFREELPIGADGQIKIPASLAGILFPKGNYFLTLQQHDLSNTIIATVAAKIAHEASALP